MVSEGAPRAGGGLTSAERVIFRAAREERKVLWNKRYRQKPPQLLSIEEEDAEIMRRMKQRLGVSPEQVHRAWSRAYSEYFDTWPETGDV